MCTLGKRHRISCRRRRSSSMPSWHWVAMMELDRTQILCKHTWIHQSSADDGEETTTNSHIKATVQDRLRLICDRLSLQQQRDGRENRERNCAKGSDYDVCSCSMNRPPALSFYLPGILCFPFSSGLSFFLSPGSLRLCYILKGVCQRWEMWRCRWSTRAPVTDKETHKRVWKEKTGKEEEKRWRWSKQTSLIILAQLCAISAATSSSSCCCYYYSLLKGGWWSSLKHSGGLQSAGLGLMRTLYVIEIVPFLFSDV